MYVFLVAFVLKSLNLSYSRELSTSFKRFNTRQIRYITNADVPVSWAGSMDWRRRSRMGGFRKLSLTIWHCQYHVIWVPKYRYRVLTGKVGESVEHGIRAVCG